MLPRAICFRLLLQLIRFAASRIFWTAGSKRPIKIAIMTITTNSSISVNPRRRGIARSSKKGRMEANKTARPHGRLPLPLSDRPGLRDAEVELIWPARLDLDLLLRLLVVLRRNAVHRDDVASARAAGLLVVGRCLAVR